MSESILIVDDDRALCEAICHWAEHAGYTAVGAWSAEEVLASLGTMVVDLAIVDYRLPGMDGSDLAHRLLEQDPDRPVILITAYGDLDNARRAVGAGIYEYFAKPFTLADLGAGVRRALAHRRLMLERQAYQEDLERQVAARTAELKAANEQLRREIVERKRVERELIRMERLRALEEMSAGVSHNLNNILTSVLGPAQLLQRVLDDPDLLQEVESIVASTRRARDLVRRLHQVTHDREGPPRPVQVNDVVRKAVYALRPHWKDGPESRGVFIEVATDLGDIPPGAGTEPGLHTVISNLLFNAVDAMPEAGTIAIRTRAVEKGVEIAVSDTGIGMDEETRRRVFEPFFTTRMEVGRGLGLYTAYGLVTGWGGSMDVESAPGEGATFTLGLPRWREPGAAEGETGEATPGRRGKILIVENEGGVCGVLCRLLRVRHDVEAVLDGREALERFAPGRYDVALIDLGMPGMPGDRVVREMRDADPSIATVLITGWEIGEGDPRLSPFDFRIQKPFEDVSEVEDAVAQAVALHDERAGGGGRERRPSDVR